MSTGIPYYHLHTNTMNPCSMDETAAESAANSWFCSGCNNPKQGVSSVDVTIQGNAPDDPPLNFVYGFGVPVARTNFLWSIGEDLVKRHLWLGRVFSSDGCLLDDWVTFRGKHRLIVRGSKNVSFRQCTTCGRTVYFAMGTRYLCPPPPIDIGMFESDLWGLIISEPLLARLKLNQWGKLVVDRLPVLTTPEDGLPELLQV